MRNLLPTLCILLSFLGFNHSSNAAFGIGDTLYLDFGKNDTTNGIIMPSAGTMNTGAGNNTGVTDSFGHYWNNAWMNFSSPGGTTPGSLTNLITSTNAGTGLGLSFSNGWQANGFQNGGLLTPSSALLGDFASPNATGDYYFVDTTTPGATANMTFSGLDPALAYDFKIFATRDNTQVRMTLYTIADVNGPHDFLLQTSGPGIGAGGTNGNNNTFATFDGIVPDGSGNITLTVTSTTNNFAYIGALQLTAVAVPEPSSMALVAAAGGVVLVVYRRRRTA